MWALAHIRSKEGALDTAAGRQGCVKAFLHGVARVAGILLSSLSTRMDVHHLQASMLEAERKFSCQALVNIAWSFASMLGEECSSNAEFRLFFLQIRREAVLRLHATSSGLQLNQVWIHRLAGGFNEQALSNIVYAFDKADLLDKELLQWVFNVAALRLDRIEAGLHGAELSFKPQELCTLLRAAHQHIAQPWTFLSKLNSVIQARPHVIAGWTTAELTELQRAFALLRSFIAPLQTPGPAPPTLPGLQPRTSMPQPTQLPQLLQQVQPQLAYMQQPQPQLMPMTYVSHSTSSLGSMLDAQVPYSTLSVLSDVDAQLLLQAQELMAVQQAQQEQQQHLHLMRSLAAAGMLGTVLQ